MFARMRKLLLSIPALVVMGLVSAYLLFGWFGFEPLVRWIVPKMVADKSGHHLKMEHARFDPLRLSVEVRGLTLTEPAGKPMLTLGRLFVDFDASSLFKRAYVFDEIRLSEPAVWVELRANGHLNWLDLADAFAGPPAQKKDDADAQPTRLLFRQWVLERGRVELVDHQVAGGFSTHINPVDLAFHNLSTLPEDRGDHTLSARTEIGANVKWKGAIGLNPLVAHGELEVGDLMLDRLWPYLKNALNNMAPPQGKATLKLNYQASYAAKVFNLSLDHADFSLEKLALRGANDPQPSIALNALRGSGGHVDLVKREASLDKVSLEGGRVAVELDAQGQPNVLKWLSPATAKPAAATPPASTASGPPPVTHGAPWRIGVGQIGVEGLGVQVVDRGFAAPLTAEIGQVKLGFKFQGSVGAGQPQVTVEGIGAEFGGIRLSSLGIDQPWFELDKVQLEEGQVNLADRNATLGRVALTGGRLISARDARGEVPLQRALSRLGAPAAGKTAQAQPPEAAAWHYRVGKVDASGFGVALQDESVSPAGKLTIDDMSANAEGVSENLMAELPVRLQFRVQQGGRFEASGKVVPGAPSADLQLKLSELSLAPAQTYVASFTNAVLASGQANAQGRVVYQQGKFRYEGGFAVKNLLLKEDDTRDRFLSWKSLGSNKLLVTPEQMKVGELLVDGLDAKLVIFKDRTVNLSRLLKPQPKPTKAAAPAKPAGNEKPFQVDVARVKVIKGKMDFADLSLALPFGARIHELKGQMVGLSSRPGRPAQLELDGQVDDYGLARAAGQINLFDPTGFTDIKVVFRNVEMTTLTPYSATFAGRKIQSGKLSLDLEYKIKKRQLEGNNQVVMDKLVLGERVESSTATNLPLDLAIAILADSDGKIDLGLPVSGSLDDPQFSYGAIIWKAFINVITKVVTAPFRALGSMLGISGDKLDKVTFDVGRAELLPPEQEKLAKIAQLLAKKPTLGLTVRGSFNPITDRDAIRELRLRQAVAQQSGVKLAVGEEPGPISTSQPATREALEKLYVQHFGADALSALKDQHEQANPDAPPPSAAGRMLSKFSSMLKKKRAPLSDQEAARLRGADLHALMMQRLLEATVVDEALLRALGQERAEAIRGELVARGVAAERVKLEESQAEQGEGAVVGSALSLDMGVKPAQAAASAVAPAR